MAEIELPGWMEKFRIDDAAMSAAYAYFPARFRAVIKTGIALSHFYFGDNMDITSQQRQSVHQGFAINSHSSSAPWTLLCLMADVAATARICAAAMLPILAGVPNIFVAILNGSPPLATLLTLELCGVEEIFSAGIGEFENLLKFLAEIERTGRVVFLHESTDNSLNYLQAISRISREMNVPFYNLGSKPRLLLTDSTQFQPDILEFTQGSHPATESVKDIFWDAIYTSAGLSCKPDIACPPAARLILSPGCEGFWVFDGLAPDSFRNSSISAELVALQ